MPSTDIRDLSLIKLRQVIAERNGRYDLVNPSTWANTGIDYYINAACRYLDTHLLSPKSFAWYRKDIIVGQYKDKIKHLLAVKEVWMMKADGKYMLDPRSLGYIRDNYYKVMASETTGTPIDFAHAVDRISPEQKALKTSDYTGDFTWDFEDVIFSDEGPHYEYTQIIWGPPSDAVYTLSVLGRFLSEILTADTDKNFYTVVHPDLLVLTTNLMIESSYRNTQGYKDREASIKDILVGLDHMQVEEEISGVNQMNEGDIE